MFYAHKKRPFGASLQTFLLFSFFVSVATASSLNYELKHRWHLTRQTDFRFDRLVALLNVSSEMCCADTISLRKIFFWKMSGNHSLFVESHTLIWIICQHKVTEMSRPTVPVEHENNHLHLVIRFDFITNFILLDWMFRFMWKISFMFCQFFR